MNEPIQIELLFPWCPDVGAGQLIETSAHPAVTMRLLYVELLDDWQIEGLDLGGRHLRVKDLDLRPLGLSPVPPKMRVTIRARNMTAESQRFPGAKIIGSSIIGAVS